MTKLIKIIISALISCLPVLAFASGMQVSPARLNFALNPTESVSQEITVANPTADVQIFEVYADDFTKNITINPASFTLEAGDRKRITITVNSNGLASSLSQQLQTNLSVVGKPLAEGKLSVGAGAKIPINITLAAASGRKWLPQLWPWKLGLILTVLVAIGGIWLKKRRSSA